MNISLEEKIHEIISKYHNQNSDLNISEEAMFELAQYSRLQTIKEIEEICCGSCQKVIKSLHANGNIQKNNA